MDQQPYQYSLTGGALVSLIVFLFLRRLGPTLIIASAIPLSIIVTFLAVYALGFTLNSVTLIASFHYLLEWWWTTA